MKTLCWLGLVAIVLAAPVALTLGQCRPLALFAGRWLAEVRQIDLAGATMARGFLGGGRATRGGRFRLVGLARSREEQAGHESEVVRHALWLQQGPGRGASARLL